jgi:hypothetical protein
MLHHAGRGVEQVVWPLIQASALCWAEKQLGTYMQVGKC